MAQISANNIINSSIYNNTLDTSEGIISNTLNDGSIYINTLNNNSSVRFNALDSSDFNYNTLDSSFFEYNTGITSYFQYNTLDNSTFNFSGSGTLSSIILSQINSKNCNVVSNISGATDIYFDCSKTIFKNNAQIPRLSYYNSSDVQIITNVDN